MFEDLLVSIGSELKKTSIPYMIIGGQAVLLYGEPRLTRDIDITIGIGIDRLSVLADAVTRIGLKILPDSFEQFARTTYVLPAIDQTSGIRVDFIFSYTPYERAAIGRAKEIALKGIPVRFAAVEDIIIHKIFAGRPRDIEDIRSILIKNPSLDTDYIRKWLKEFDKSSERPAFSDTFKSVLDSLL